MAAPPNNLRRPRRPQGPPTGPNTAVAAVGAVRRSQAITTYGIGAVIDLESGSFMPMGLEDWDSQISAERRSAAIIYEARLQGQLGVDHFRLPPIEEESRDDRTKVDSRSTVPVVRFPAWHECPHCHRLGSEGDPFQTSPDGNQLQCVGCGQKAVNPVRFIVACHRGHAADFPWEWWAHRTRPEGICNHPTLFLQSKGQSASLADLFVKCRNEGCGASHSMGDALTSGVFKGMKCRGFRPWLHDRQTCDMDQTVVQRGASNVHFANTASALSIPPVSEPLSLLLDDMWGLIQNLPKDAVKSALAGYATKVGVDPDELFEAYEIRRRIERGEEPCTEEYTRAQEYVALSTSRDDRVIAGMAPQFCNEAMAAPEALSKWFDLIGAVSRLREVRALAGFTRIEPYPVSGEKIAIARAEGKIASLSKGPRPWLPAAELRGEGIFLRFRTEAIDQWISGSPAAVARASLIESIAKEAAQRKALLREYPITARLLLVHSFAHALIRRLSIDCGYSSSSLRERLYVSDGVDGRPPMNGVLIYTGSADSEGSLGGLVRLAEPSLIVDAVTRAVRGSRWCGSDPVCRETDPKQAGERLSGASCHCCLLLPETACEKFNQELDRTMAVGSGDAGWLGFFQGLGES
jgi:hypothetical protein